MTLKSKPVKIRVGSRKPRRGKDKTGTVDRSFRRDNSAGVASRSDHGPRNRARIRPRVEAQRRTQSADSLQSSVLDQVNEVIVACDRSGRIVVANQAARWLCKENPLSKPFEAVFPLRAGRAPSLWRVVERRKRSGAGIGFTLSGVLGGQVIRAQEVRLRQSDGSERFMLVSAAPRLDPQGAVEGCIVSMTDVTERRRVEDALQASGVRLTRLAESNAIGVMSADAEHILEANEAFLKIVGYSRDYLLERRLVWREMTPPEYWERDERSLEELTARGSCAPYEKEYIRRDGSRVPVLASAALLEESPLRWASFVLDLTDRKRAEDDIRKLNAELERRVAVRTFELEAAVRNLREEAAAKSRMEAELRQSEERYRTLFDGVPMGLYRTTPDGRFLDVNPALVRMLGYSDRESLLSVEVKKLYVIPEERARWRRLMDDETVVRGFETQLRRRDGQAIWVRHDAQTVRDDAGRVSCYEGAVEDVTARKLAEQARRASEELFRLAVDNFPSAIEIYDPQRRVQFANARALELMGRTEAELAGRTDEELFSPEVAEPYLSILKRAVETRMTQRGQVTWAPASGRMTLTVAYVPLLDDEGKLRLILGVLEDVTDRVRTAEALEESRAEFQALLESAPDAIVSVNRDGQIVLVNSQMEQMFGYERQELLGQPVEILVPKRYHDIHRQNRAAFAEMPTTRPMGAGLVLTAVRKDGRELPVEISLSPVQTKQGLLVMSIIRDITERRQAEEALEKQATRLQEQANLLELAHETIMVRDLDGRITFWNHGAEQMYGWAREQALGQVTHTLLKTKFPVSPDQVRDELLETGRWEGELEHTTRDGQRIVVASRQVVQRDEDGRAEAILEINRDITRRRQAEDALRQSEERFRTMVEQVRDYAIFGLDPQGRVASWNAGAERFTGYRAEEIVGQHFSRFYRPEDVERHKPDHELEVATAEGRYEEEGLRLRKDGAEYWAHVVITALRNPEGSLRGFAKLTRDITQRRQAEEEIRALNAELERRVSELATVNRELEAFSYSVSHDLRAPLRGIAGFSQALAEDYADVLDAQGRDYTRRIQAATHRMTQLIDDLLNLSRVTRSEMHRESVDLSAIARTIASQLSSSQPERPVQFFVAPGLIAEGDSHLLGIALENLIGNAWKFTSKRPSARIEFGSDGSEKDRTVYFVRDNGAGFDMSYADKLFGPFQRLHSSSEFPGTGIGLATVQRIIHRHGGRVWAEGGVDQGATFYFTL